MSIGLNISQSHVCLDMSNQLKALFKFRVSGVTRECNTVIESITRGPPFGFLSIIATDDDQVTLAISKYDKPHFFHFGMLYLNYQHFLYVNSNY